MIAKGTEGIVCDLRHGIRLEIHGDPVNIPAQMVGDFLAKAMRHFKHHRDVLKTDVYGGPMFSQTYSIGRSKKTARPVTIHLTHLGSQSAAHLTAALWVDAVIPGYTCVNTIEQIIEDLANWRQALARDGQSPFLRDVVGRLDKPGGEMQAVQMMLKDSMETALAEGRYKPGVVLPA